MLCKADNCNNVVGDERVYCSTSCRSKTTNLLYKNYSKSGESLRNKKKSQYKVKFCRTCSKELPYELRRNIYCDHSCSATGTNIGRRHTNKTKQKISRSLVNYAKSSGNYTKIPSQGPKYSRNCRICLKVTKNKFYCSNLCAALDRTIKSNATKTEREKYKAACKFTFGIKDHPTKFDIALVEQYGWYSAKNRGNNSGGVSRDHMLSISDGFKQNIPPEMISHPANCRLILQSDNASKGKKSSITREQLQKRIDEW